MSKIKRKESDTGGEIAVIGMSGRFPGAKNISEFWDNLKNGVESITFFSDEELEKTGINSRLLPDPYFVKAKGVLSGIEYFDASFFDYSPGEAEMLDPQFRTFLEVAWESLENAGGNAFSYRGVIGLFAGNSSNLFWTKRSLTQNTSQGMGKNNFSKHIAGRLNLKGVDVKVQRESSNSLAAIHLACQSLITGECSMALAGGVSISLPQKTGYIYREGRINSPDGRCRAFDASAKGTNAGDGAGIVVLKKLYDAVRDGDCIYAVIKGSALSERGRGTGNGSQGIPGITEQKEVIAKALERADVDPESIVYIETNGIGTRTADAGEIEALTQAFNTGKKGFCAVGTLKPNIGHLDTSAGAAGFIKTVLILKHKMLPPTLNFEIPNPDICFLKTPFYVNTELSGLKNVRCPLRAGVSCFGADGINTHVILEEAPGDSGTPTIPDLPTYALERQKFDIGGSEPGFFRSRAIEQEDVLDANGFPTIEPAEKKDYYPLSFPQQELYRSPREDPKHSQLHITRVVPLEALVERKRLEKNLLKLIKRHEILRTSFRAVESQPVQKIHDEVAFEIKYYDPGSRQQAFDNFVRPFDLSKAPLWRVGVIKNEKGKYLLMVDMHQMIADWNAVDIFIKELKAVYDGEELPPLRIQYKDYSQWQNAIWKKKNNGIKQQEKYWLKEFKGEIPVFDFPTDYERAVVMNPRGSTLNTLNTNTVNFEIGIDKTRALKKVAMDEGVTVYTLLLAITFIFLLKISNREEIVIGTLAQGRRHAGLEQIPGVFTNTLILKNFFRLNQPFILFLEDTGRKMSKAFDNQDYPFQQLVRRVKNRDNYHNPLFNVMFIYCKSDENMNPIPLTCQNRGTMYTYDMRLAVEDAGCILLFALDYNKTLFKKETIERYSRHIREVLSVVVENKDTRLKDITISHDIWDTRGNIPPMDFGF